MTTTTIRRQLAWMLGVPAVMLGLAGCYGYYGDEEMGEEGVYGEEYGVPTEEPIYGEPTTEPGLNEPGMTGDEGIYGEPTTEPGAGQDVFDEGL